MEKINLQKIEITASSTKFELKHFVNCVFTDINPGEKDTVFSECQFENCTFSDFYIDSFTKCFFNSVNFINCSTHEKHWNRFHPSYFKACNLSGVKFIKSSIHHFQIDDSILRGVKFEECDFDMHFDFYKCDAVFDCDVEMTDCKVQFSQDIWHKNMKDMDNVFSPRICLVKTTYDKTES